MKKILLFITTILILVSCEKDSTNSTSEIHIGQSSGMHNITYDTLLTCTSFSNAFVDLDIDFDGKMDFRFDMNYTDFEDDLRNPVSNLICLHSGSEVLGYLENDSIFYYEEPDTEKLIVSYNCFEIITPEASSSLYEVKTDQPKLEPKYYNEIINKTDSFILDTITIIGKTSTKYLNHNYDAIYKDFSCDDLPLNKVIYIGIKMVYGDNEKLGWIKLFLTEKDKIIIFESSIQQ